MFRSQHGNMSGSRGRDHESLIRAQGNIAVTDAVLQHTHESCPDQIGTQGVQRLPAGMLRGRAVFMYAAIFDVSFIRSHMMPILNCCGVRGTGKESPPPRLRTRLFR